MSHPTNIPRGPFVCTNKFYHADKQRISHSSLEVFGRSIPEFQARYVTLTQPDPPSTKAQALGTLMHCLLLEPDHFTRDFAVKPPDLPKAGSAKHTEWLQSLPPDVTIVTADEVAKAHEMVSSVQEWAINAVRNPRKVPGTDAIALALLDPSLGMVEHTIGWNDDLTGIPCKTRMDLWLPNYKIVVDIKTASDPLSDKWGRKAHELGYHRAIPFYLHGIRDIYGLDDVRFIHVVVGSSGVHEVCVHEMDPYFISIGEFEVRQQLDELSNCLATGDWTGRESFRINSLKPPPWADKKRSAINAVEEPLMEDEEDSED